MVFSGFVFLNVEYYFCLQMKTSSMNSNNAQASMLLLQGFNLNLPKE